MFGLIIFGTHTFGTLLQGEGVVKGQVWVDQCPNNTQWDNLPLENTGWNTEPVAVTAWEDQKENTTLTQRCR